MITDQESLEITKRFFKSVRETSDVLISVADNASILGSDLLKKNADIYIRNEENLGVTKAANQLISIIKEKYIVTASNNSIFYKGWEEVYVSILENVPECGSIRYAPRPHEIKSRVWYEPVSMTTATMLRKETFDRLGLYDEKFFNTWCDLDFIFRMREHGLFNLCTDLCKVEKMGDATTSRKLKGFDEQFLEGKKWLIEKWCGSEMGTKLLREYFTYEDLSGYPLLDN